jgi:hypothetical protein
MLNMMVGKLKLLEISKEAQFTHLAAKLGASLYLLIVAALMFSHRNNIIHYT